MGATSADSTAIATTKHRMDRQSGWMELREAIHMGYQVYECKHLLFIGLSVRSKGTDYANWHWEPSTLS